MPDIYDYIVGVDPSLTDTGIVVLQRLRHGKWSLLRKESTVDLAKKPEVEREYAIARRVYSIVNEYCRDANVGVAIENHSYRSFTGKAKTRAELVGVIKYLLLVTAGVDVFMIAPMSLKKFMGCSGKRTKKNKDDMFLAASRMFNFVSVNNNLVDAYCLARYLAANREGQRLTIVKYSARPQLRIVQSIAPKKVLKPAKNLRLTIRRPGSSLTIAR